MARRHVLLAVTAAVLGAGPPSTSPQDAHAAAVDVVNIPTGSRYYSRAALRFTADAGEANDVVVSGGTADVAAITFRDPGAVLRAGYGCSARDEHEVVCDPAVHRVRWTEMEISLGDRDDAIRTEGTPLAVDGGEGDDRLLGGPGFDRLTGGAGRDALSGGAGGDLLRDGSSEPDPDELDGGPGTDSVSYTRTHAAVTVVLGAQGRGGSDGEDDRLLSVESAHGGAGADMLLGTPETNILDGGKGADLLLALEGDDQLVGGPGDDLLEAGPGRDRLAGQPGRDRLRGGAGGDRLNPDDGGVPSDRDADRVFCGRGRDAVSAATRLDVLRTGCERVNLFDTLDTVFLAHPLRSYGGPLAIYAAELPAQTSAVSLRLAGRPSVHVGGATPTARDRRLAIRLSAYGMALLRRRGRLTLELRIVVDDSWYPRRGLRMVVRAPR